MTVVPPFVLPGSGLIFGVYAGTVLEVLFVNSTPFYQSDFSVSAIFGHVMFLFQQSCRFRQKIGLASGKLCSIQVSRFV